jgi:hypothetical protein
LGEKARNRLGCEAQKPSDPGEIVAIIPWLIEATGDRHDSLAA